jgi:hypothetical protein
MRIVTGTYIFECYLMPWTEIELGLGVGCEFFEIPLELSNEDIQALADMMNWAWDNEWFEHSTSETVCTELLKKLAPQIFERIQPLVHQQFCRKYPNSENVQGFGVYEIFIPDEIIEYARENV